MLNIKKLLPFGYILGSLLLIPAAHADTDTEANISDVLFPETFTHNIYLEGNFGYSHTDIDFFDDEESGYGFTINMGYQFSPYFAVETGFLFVQPLEMTIEGVDLTQDVFAVHVSAKGIYPIQDTGFSLFAKGGPAYTYTKAEISGAGPLDDDANKSGISPLLGAGVAYAFNENLEMNAQWNGLFSVSNVEDCDSFNVNLVTVGLAYKFLLS